MKNFWKEFKIFINKGNVLGLAVGVIIGGAFSTITTSLTNDIIMPIVSIFLGGVDFSTMSVALPTFFPLEEGAAPNTLNYGSFLSAVINFLILALVVFLIVKVVNKAISLAKKKEEEVPPAPPEPSNEEKLLMEIRDLLREQNNR
ncbi:MAG TPA: large-conductance mechanosensitive channel protein MscL [Candidatus Enterenecus stercoripullorum]|nr:large-conductance mechanosensitive channel protein MscL [Candidatus Enterenecus stercoripullorum]